MRSLRLTAIILLLCLKMSIASSLVETIIPTSEDSGQLWKYTFESPSDIWQQTDFDDSSWQEGTGGFGSIGIPYGIVRTVWEEKDIWLRQEITLDKKPNLEHDLALRIHHDEDTEVFLNGELIARVEGWSKNYTTVNLNNTVFALLRKGKNTLAIHCQQTIGGQYVDVGLETINRWKPIKARQWYARSDWPCGFNYVPANAISYTEMWMDYCFDPKLIDAEMVLAEKTGFNCVRVVLPFVVWEHEPEVFKARLDKFLEICDSHGLRVMPTFFDDCAFGRIIDPTYGQQPEAVPGWYANGWTPSPGHSIVRDSSQWPRLKSYVSDLTKSFRDDKRIICWDVYNEPTNSGLGDTTLPLLELVFQWAHAQQPTQPLTAGIFNGDLKLNAIIMRYSDIITFHSYDPAGNLTAMIKELKGNNRPIICTEWLNRSRGSTVDSCLPVFAREDVGCMHWGLVNGKTQTDLPWGHRPGDPEASLWQHDLYRGNFNPYDQMELDIFRNTIIEMKDK